MKLAIIGSGISGLVCAHELHGEHDITLFESGDWIGGHSHTVDVTVDGATFPVDTGFIVFNRRNYPGFCRIIDGLGVESAPTTMSFSVRDDRAGLEYGGATLRGLFAQRRNLFRPAHYRMLRDIKRFGPLALRAAVEAEEEATLGGFLDGAGFSDRFVDHYLLPMAGAIWSAPTRDVREFPLRPFVDFFDAHGMLTPWDPPQWRHIVGGSRSYVRSLVAPFRDRVRLASPVRAIHREPMGVFVELLDGSSEMFDEVIVATHSDQALRILAAPTDVERETLGAIPYLENDVVLHTDASMLPRRRRAWAGWNYHMQDGSDSEETTRSGATVTYCMNILQRLPTTTPVCVTLNTTHRIDPDCVIDRYTYHHPMYSADTFRAQRRWAEISGVDRVHYCGAYWGYGFHEDGVRSALRVCARMGVAA